MKGCGPEKIGVGRRRRWWLKKELRETREREFMVRRLLLDAVVGEVAKGCT